MSVHSRVLVSTSRVLYTMLACSVLLAAGGCSGARSAGQGTVAPVMDSARPEITSGGLPVLPPPSQLTASGNTQGLLDGQSNDSLNGSDYSAQLPNHRVSIESFKAVFSPMYSLDTDSADKDPAYACYRFTVPEYTKAFPKLHLNWMYHVPGAAVDTGPAYAGLANLAADRWDWFEIQHTGGDEPNLIFFNHTGYVELDSLEPYFNSFGELVLAVVLLGTSEEKLWHLNVGMNYPPQGQLYATQGAAPLAVNLTAAIDDEDGLITQTTWDFESDGVTDASGPLNITHTYPAPGSYDVTVEATDNNGATSTFHLPVVASQWSVTRLPEDLSYVWSADMALDSTGQPHLVANSSSLGLVYVRLADGGWITETISLDNSGYLQLALALDGSDQPHVLVSDFDSQSDTHGTTYATRHSDTWQLQQLGWDAEALEAAWDADNGLHAAWVATDSGTDPTAVVAYALRTAGQWSTPLYVEIESSYSSGLALALDDQSRSHLATAATAPSAGTRLLYLTADDTGLIIEDSVQLSDKYTKVYSMALDAQGNPHVLLSGGTEQYGMRAGGSWQFISLHEAAHSGALAIDSSYHITVALGTIPFDFGMEAHARILRHSQSGWVKDELFNTSSTVFALQLDPEDRPVLCVANDMNGLCLETLLD